MSRRIEGRNHDLEEASQRRSLPFSQATEQSILLYYEVLQRSFDTLAAFSGESHSNGPSIFRIDLASNQPPLLQVMETVRHRP
jgi:hypothetical protein